MAGRSCVFGFGFDPVTEAISAAVDDYLGDGSAFADELRVGRGNDGLLKDLLADLLADWPGIPVDSLLLCPAADMAVETAVNLARTQGDGDRFSHDRPAGQ